MNFKITTPITALSLLGVTLAQAQTQICNIPASHISNFTSVLPSAQPDSLRIPATHAFQLLVQSGEPYTNPAHGNVKGLFDFTGYVALNGSSRQGFINLNHEGGNAATGGVSVLDVAFNNTTRLWDVSHIQPVDFGPVQGTGRNCSGGITPWMTSITSEETLPGGDANNDGYLDIGWNVEIDPVTRSIPDYDQDGTPDKLFQMGRMSHENVVVASDSMTVYQANDENPGYVFKFVARTKGRLHEGDLYVLKLDGAIGMVNVGKWVKVPNSTPAECNNVRSAATALGATNFSSLEDVEISPLDGMIYFTSKSSSRVYRFRDYGTTIGDLDVFVGNPSQQYLINHEGGQAYEQWRDGNDNLTFDDLGNLYVIQDGGRNHIWMVKPCHTQANPKVELFAVTPAGSEPTGMTFSPDYRFMFVSIQHPSGSNTTAMRDAAGDSVVFNRETAIVIARKEYLGQGSVTGIGHHNLPAAGLEISKVYPNPATDVLHVAVSSPAGITAQMRVFSMSGLLVQGRNIELQAGQQEVNLQTAGMNPGVYQVVITAGGVKTQARFVKQ